MAITIDEVRLPDDIESGAEIGPSFQTSIMTLTSGKEYRNSDWANERIRANISYGVMYDSNGTPYDDGAVERTFRDILSFYRARKGRFRGFLFRDWSDYSYEDVEIGTGDGTNKDFQLKLIYSSYERKITRPVADTVKVYVDGIEAPFTLGPLGSIVITTAPGVGDVVTADFDFDLPVRFDTDVMQVMMHWVRAGEIKDIELIGLMDE